MHRLRAVLPAAAMLLATVVAPARAADPLVLVAASDDGTLVHVTLVGRVAMVRDLVPSRPDVFLMPSQAVGSSVAYTTTFDRTDRSDVSLVDVETGARRAVSADGRTLHLLVSPDGRSRYLLTAGPDHRPAALVRTDAAGRSRRTLVARAGGRRGAVLSGTALSPDGRTVYVARTVPGSPSVLYAVDTATGARRTVPLRTPYGFVYNVVASPDGTMLALSYSDSLAMEGTRVAVVRLDGSVVRTFQDDAYVHASAFTPSGRALVLSREQVVGDLVVAGLAVADLSRGVVQPVAGTAGLRQAVPVR